MENLVHIFVVYLFIFSIALLTSNGKVTSPSVIFSVSFIVMLFLSIISYDYFRFNINEKTSFLLCSAGIFFYVTECLYIISHNQKGMNFSSVDIEHMEPIHVDPVMLNLLLIFSAFVALFMLMILFVNFSGSFISRMNEYKTAMQVNSGSIRFRFIGSQLYKVELGIAYVVAYIIVYNKAINKKTKINIKEVLIILLYMVTAFISEAARQPVIEIILFLIICYLLLMQKEGKKRKIIKTLLRMIPICLILAIAFYYSMTLAGRVFHEGKAIIHYVSEYICGGLYSLNLHINEPARSAYFGKVSFVEIYIFLAKIGLFPSNLVSIHEFDKYGNTATIFGRWYEDFGISGVYIMSFGVSLFFSHMYYKTLKTKSQTLKMHSRYINYSFLVLALVWSGYDDRIKAILSTTMLLKLACIYFFYYILIRRPVHIRVGHRA